MLWLPEVKSELSDGEGKEAGGDVVKHDAGALGEAFEAADGPGLGDIEETEEEEAEDGESWGGGEGDEGDELAGYLVDDDVAGVFAAGFAGDDGSGGDADERGDYCGYGCADCEC